MELDRASADVNEFEWPLTVDAVEVRCEPGEILIARPVGEETEYALNGLAKGAGYVAIDPIWADDPAMDGLKISIGELIALADAVTADC